MIVSSFVDTVTVMGTPETGATTVITPTDADAKKEGHQVAVGESRVDTVAIEVSNEMLTSSTYYVYVVRRPPSPTVTIAAGTSPVTEGTAAEFTVTMTPAATGPVTVTVTVTDSGDFAASGETGDQTVSFASGDATKTVTVPTRDNEDVESDGSVTVTLQRGDDYLIGDPRSATVVGYDDDVTVTIKTIPDRDAVTEGTAAEFTVTMTPAPTAARTVNVNVTQVGDFAASGETGDKTVSFASDETTKTVKVPTRDDAEVEDNGSVTATLQTGTGYTVGTPASAQGF